MGTSEKEPTSAEFGCLMSERGLLNVWDVKVQQIRRTVVKVCTYSKEYKAAPRHCRCQVIASGVPPRASSTGTIRALLAGGAESTKDQYSPLIPTWNREQYYHRASRVSQAVQYI